MSQASRTPSPALEDLMSFSEDEQTPSPRSSRELTPASHETRLSDAGTPSSCEQALALPRMRPRRAPPPPPQSLETYLRHLSPTASHDRAQLAQSILGQAVRQWGSQHPMPVALERLFVSTSKKVSLSDDDAGRKALMCSAALQGPAETAKQVWVMAGKVVLELYMTPRPSANDPARSRYHAQARAQLKAEHPKLDAWLTQVETTDFTKPCGHLLQGIAAL